jgi:hypothetical protein
LEPRKGRRRYLSEDYDVLPRLVSVVVERVVQVRELRMQNLVSQADCGPAGSDQSTFPVQFAEYAVWHDGARQHRRRRLVLNCPTEAPETATNSI